LTDICNEGYIIPPKCIADPRITDNVQTASVGHIHLFNLRHELSSQRCSSQGTIHIKPMIVPAIPSAILNPRNDVWNNENSCGSARNSENRGGIITAKTVVNFIANPKIDR